MTAAQRAAVALSETRTRINELLGVTDRTDEQNTELRSLTDKAIGQEAEFRAATVAGEDPEIRDADPNDAETRERRELRQGSSIAAFLRSAVDGEPLTGKAAEYRASLGVPAGQMPVDLLAEAPEAGPEEHRAATPGVTLPGSKAPIAPLIFQRTAAAALGVQFPVVQAGESHYPILTTAPTASRVAKGADAPETAGAFRLDTRKPGRVSGAFTVRVEDLALMPGMENALRGSMNDALGETVDEAVFNADATDPNDDDKIRGLYAQAAEVTAATAIETFQTGIKRYADLVDGKHCYGWKDIRTIIGPATFARYASVFQSNGDMSLYDYLSSKLGSVRVSDRVPDKASKAQKNICALTGARMPIRVPVWQGVRFIRDEVTGAGKGEVKLTALLLIGSPHLPYGQNTIKLVHPKIES